MTAARKLAPDFDSVPPPARRPVLRRVDFHRQDTLVMEYRPLAEKLVQQALARAGRRTDAEELRSAAHLGLVEAVRRYDPARGIAFGAFARHRIAGAILDELRAMDPLGRPARSRARDVERARARLERRLSREPTEEELARAVHEDVETFRRRAAHQRSQLTVAVEDLPERAREELLTSPEPSPLDRLCEAERRHLAVRALAALPARLKRMLALYFDEEKSLKEIGRLFGVCESRVCQLIKSAERQLRLQLA